MYDILVILVDFVEIFQFHDSGWFFATRIRFMKWPKWNGSDWSETLLFDLKIWMKTPYHFECYMLVRLVIVDLEHLAEGPLPYHFQDLVPICYVVVGYVRVWALKKGKLVYKMLDSITVVHLQTQRSRKKDRTT